MVAPLVRPATKSFCRMKKRMAGGMMASSVPARKMPYSCTYRPMYWFSTTGRGSFDCVCTKIWGCRKEFHVPRNVMRQ